MRRDARLHPPAQDGRAPARVALRRARGWAAATPGRSPPSTTPGKASASRSRSSTTSSTSRAAWRTWARPPAATRASRRRPIRRCTASRPRAAGAPADRRDEEPAGRVRRPRRAHPRAGRLRRRAEELAVSAITGVYAREILDSRGNPTVEVEVQLESGAWGRAAVPSGASTGKREAVELRDGDGQRYRGKGVRQAVRNVEETIAPEVEGMDASEQAAIDQALLELDGTPNKSALGANAILARVARGGARRGRRRRAAALRLSRRRRRAALPVPMMNVLNGGAHADNGLDFQEFMLVPAGADSFSNALRMGVGDLPRAARSSSRAKELVDRRRRRGRLRAGPGLQHRRARSVRWTRSRRPATGPATTSRWRSTWPRASSPRRAAATACAARTWCSTSEEMIDRYEPLVERYPIVSIEDGLGEDDWAGWALLTQRARRPRPAGRRRPLRHQPGHHPAGHPEGASPTPCSSR